MQDLSSQDRPKPKRRNFKPINRDGEWKKLKINRNHINTAMPLDINFFREAQGGRPDLIRESQRKRFASVEIVDEIIEKDDKWRHLTGAIDDYKKHKNKIQKEQIAIKMKNKQNCDIELA